jgi:hypothetical protein
MTKDEALKLALEALKTIDEAMPFPVAKLAQAAIKEALAQPEQLSEENERLHVENRRLIDRIETIGVPVGVGGFATTTSVQPEQEPVAKIVSTAPERIWLDLGFDPTDEDDISFHDLVDTTWSEDNATGYGIEYVRADTTPPQRKPLTGQMTKQMRESCDSYEMRGAFVDGWLSAEAAHGIKGEA